MQSTTQQVRQTWGCAFEGAPDENLLPIQMPELPAGTSLEPTVCPGFTTSLPEVIEVARARLHWSKGAIMAFCRGQPRGALLLGIEALEGEIGQCQQWALDNPIKKGGA